MGEKDAGSKWTQAVFMRLQPETVAKLDAIARGMGGSRAAVVELLVSNAEIEYETQTVQVARLKDKSDSAD